MKESGATWWRSLDCASVITCDAELGDRNLSLAPPASRLKHQLPASSGSSPVSQARPVRQTSLPLPWPPRVGRFPPKDGIARELSPRLDEQAFLLRPGSCVRETRSALG